MVRPDWHADCIEAGARLPEKSYLLKPTANDHEEDTFLDNTSRILPHEATMRIEADPDNLCVQFLIRRPLDHLKLAVQSFISIKET